ncbi:MAG: 4Fe-4S binding protein [Treponema sp.]|nr:4Fe-4S binding protein [Treponema sp.]MCL2252235.1 4Fe-4S binding protein [Treponema sp.]
MAHKISDSCVNCGACTADCPMEAISEGDGQHVIDPAKCSDCGACVSSCPTDSISAG